MVNTLLDDGEGRHSLRESTRIFSKTRLKKRMVKYRYERKQKKWRVSSRYDHGVCLSQFRAKAGAGGIFSVCWEDC